MLQEKTFAESEADRWFQRNSDALHHPEYGLKDPLIDVLQLYQVQPKRVLEVGCSNGYRLEKLRKMTDCQAIGVEPSGLAVADGKKLYPEVEFHQGMMSSLPLPDASVDLIMVPFVLCILDRATLLRSLAEIDRVLCDDGLLLIADFNPPQPQKVPYHHLAGQEFFTYKQDYSTLFLSSGIYLLVAALDYCHVSREFRVEAKPHQRSQVTLLRKNLKTHSPATPLPI